MKLSKFLKDIVYTGLSQILVMAAGILLMKLMAMVLDKEHFGLFMLVRRYIPVLVPALTLNLTIGLVRYVSAEPQNARYFMNGTLAISSMVWGIFAIVLAVFHNAFSVLLFDSPNYSILTLLMVLLLLGQMIILLAISYFRGQMEINRANIIRIYYFCFPVLPAAIFLMLKGVPGIHLLYIYCIVYGIWTLLVCIYYLAPSFSPATLIKTGRRTLGPLMTFSLTRIPSVVILPLILGVPAFIALKNISVVEAGYAGIMVAVVQLLEVFSMPFNLIILPKFSALDFQRERKLIEDHTKVVLDFIYTFLPLLVVLMYGLNRFIVVLWFGPTYLVAAPSVGAAILSSAFYLAYALIRGILDGLYVFPYLNIITLAAFIPMGVLSLFFGDTLMKIALVFSLGIFILGAASIGLLLKKLKLSFEILKVMVSLVSSFLVFVLLHYGDMYISGKISKGILVLGICVLFRGLVVLPVWFFYWRKRLWYLEILKRIKFKQGKSAAEEITVY